MKKIITLSIAAIMALGLMSFDILYGTGEANYTGSPADGGADCAACHADFAVNTGGGAVSISALPSLASGYTAGAAYTISVTVTKAGKTFFGFGFEALKSGNTDGGTLAVLNAGTQLMGSAPTNMVQTDAAPGAGAYTFTFLWTAPSASTGTVTFYAAGNACDGDGGTGGDNVYTTSLAVGEAVSGSAITINAGSYNLNAGISLTQNTDTLPVVAITPGASGAGMTWDFTSLVARETGTNTIINANTGVLYSKFTSPVPNACMNQDGTNYIYFDKSAGKIDLLGYAGDLLQNATNNALVMSNPETVITFPSTYNTTFNDVSFYDSKYPYGATVQGVFVDSVREKETVTITSVMDGWGTVITPTSGTAGYPCIRQKVTKVSVDSTWAKIFMGGFHYWISTSGTTTTSISYSYISDMILGGAVVDIQMKANATGTANTDISEVKWNPAAVLAANITASTNILCFGNNTGSATVNATGGTGPYSYSWNTAPVQTTATANGLAAGSYTVTVTDANSFVTTATVTITGPAAALAATTSYTNDNGTANGTATVTASGGTGTLSYLWSPGSQTTATATGLATGSYNVLVTDANGCNNNYTVFVNSTLAGTATTMTSASYNLTNGTALALKIDTLPVVAITPGNSGVNVTWDFSGLVERKASSNTFITPSTGLLYNSFTSPVPNACINQDNANYLYFDKSTAKIDLLGYAGDLLQTGIDNALVLNNPETVLTFPSTYGTGFADASAYDSKYEYGATVQGVFVDSVREKETVSITSIMDGFGTVITPTSGSTGFPCLRQKITKVSVDSTWAKIFMGGFHYWINTSGTTSTSISYSYLSDMILGGSVVDIQMKTNATGSANTDISEVKWNPAVVLAATVSTSTNVLCFGNSTGSATVTATGGTSSYSYAWTPSGGTAATATGLTAGTYTATITDANGFTTTAIATITEPSSGIAATTSSTPETVAGNGTATVTASGGTGTLTYLWAPSGGTSNTATGLTGGTYTVTITDGNGCINTQTELVQTTIGIIDYVNSEIAIYPNPASNDITISNPSNETLTVSMVDLSGREVVNSEIISGQNAKISVLNIANGTYILKVNGKAGLVKSGKIVVMH